MPHRNEAETVARRLLTELQDAVSARELEALSALFDEEATLFGTGSENLDREQTLAYLRQVVAQPGTIQWEWAHVQSLVADDNVCCFAVVGTVGMNDWSPEQRQPFRLTCVAVRDGARWRLRHFHGSVPQQG
jgi:uncharacterized protein (TIGR02246 family)